MNLGSVKYVPSRGYRPLWELRDHSRCLAITIEQRTDETKTDEQAS